MSHEFSEKQIQAIELLASGKKFSDIAETLQIDRRSLWRWRQLPEFQQALHEQQDIRREQVHESLAELLQLSLKTTTNGLIGGYFSDRVNIALKVLKLFPPACLSTHKPAPTPIQATAIPAPATGCADAGTGPA